MPGPIIDAKFRVISPRSAFRWTNPRHVLGLLKVLAGVVLHWRLRAWERQSNVRWIDRPSLAQRVAQWARFQVFFVGGLAIIFGVALGASVIVPKVWPPASQKADPGYWVGEVVAGRQGATWQYLGGEHTNPDNWRAVK